VAWRWWRTPAHVVPGFQAKVLDRAAARIKPGHFLNRLNPRVVILLCNAVERLCYGKRSQLCAYCGPGVRRMTAIKQIRHISGCPCHRAILGVPQTFFPKLRANDLRESRRWASIVLPSGPPRGSRLTNVVSTCRWLECQAVPLRSRFSCTPGLYHRHLIGANAPFVHRAAGWLFGIRKSWSLDVAWFAGSNFSPWTLRWWTASDRSPNFVKLFATAVWDLVSHFLGALPYWCRIKPTLSRPPTRRHAVRTGDESSISDIVASGSSGLSCWSMLRGFQADFSLYCWGNKLRQGDVSDAEAVSDMWNVDID